MARVIERVGPCTLAPQRDYFSVLCKAIFNQQLSTKVAAVLFSRFRDLFPRRRPGASALLAMIEDDAKMRSCGLSRQKRRYLHDLAPQFDAGQVPTRPPARLADEEELGRLTQQKSG